MNEMRHFFLYAKGWYKRTNTMDDLKKIVEHVSGCPYEHVSNVDVMAWLWECTRPLVLKNTTRLDDLMSNWYKGENIVDRLLGTMSVCSKEDLEQPIMPPNYSILPLPDDCEHTIKTLKEWGYTPEQWEG